MEFKEDLFVKWLSECKYRVRSEYKVYPEQLVAPGIISKAYMENKCWGSVTSLCILEISHRLQSPQGSAGRGKEDVKNCVLNCSFSSWTTWTLPLAEAKGNQTGWYPIPVTHIQWPSKQTATWKTNCSRGRPGSCADACKPLGGRNTDM